MTPHDLLEDPVRIVSMSSMEKVRDLATTRSNYPNKVFTAEETTSIIKKIYQKTFWIAREN